MIKQSALLVLLLVAACGKKSAPSCSDAVAHAVSLAETPKSTSPDWVKYYKDGAAAAVKVETKLCESDSWKADVLACMQAATTATDAKKCQDMLPADEITKVTVEISDATSKIEQPHHPDGAAQ